MTIQQLFIERLESKFGEYAFDICRYYFDFQTNFQKTETIDLLKVNGFFCLAQYDLNRLLAGVPVQYVVGLTEVAGLEFKTSHAALIPRPETEELILLVDKTNHFKNQEAKVIDIGTGSGIISISLKNRNKEWEVYGLDISRNALELTKKNAQRNQVEIKTIQHSIFDFYPTCKYDIIISNPPYIPQDECKSLESSVRLHEPLLALEVPNEAPLLIYEEIVKFAVKNLNKTGSLYFEIHQSFGKEMLNLVSPYFKESALQKDFAGNDRFIIAHHLI